MSASPHSNATDTTVAVVTGAAGAIGAAVAGRLRSEGHTVVGLDLHEADHVVQCDVTDEHQVNDAVAQVIAIAGPIGILVHAAGITGKGGVEAESAETWRHIIDVNLTSAFLVTRAIIPSMRGRGSGAIVLIASVNARFGGSALSGPAYAASKGGLVTLARFLAREHAVDGIVVNALAPGPHATPMWDALDVDRRSQILAMIPGGHGPGDPNDLAATVVHLCRPESRFITGATIDINGGQWMG